MSASAPTDAPLPLADEWYFVVLCMIGKSIFHVGEESDTLNAYCTATTK